MTNTLPAAFLAAPILTAAVTLPLAAMVAVARLKDESHARAVTISALAGVLLLGLEALREVTLAGGALLSESWSSGLGAQWLAVDGLSGTLMALFPALALVSLIGAPRREVDRRLLVSTLIVVSATFVAYLSQNLLTLVVGWTGSLLPLLVRGKREGWPFVSRLTMTGSAVLLGVAAGLSGITGADTGLTISSLDSLSFATLTHSNANPFVLTLLVTAAFLRAGIFPAHRGVTAAMGGGTMLLSTLLMNSHPGLFLVARLVVPVLREQASFALPWIFGLSIFTALYMAIMGLAGRKPDVLLATVFVSQSAGLLAGLVTGTPEGVTGALLQWLVLAICSTVLAVVYRSLAARTGDTAGEEPYMGLAGRTPRFAAFFAISALALVGMPGTLGFAGEDLLMHGALSVHPWLGAALPIAIALNAYHVFRLFAHLFLGKQNSAFAGVRDALPRERWTLSACLLLLLCLGVMPSLALLLRAPAAHAILGTR